MPEDKYIVESEYAVVEIDGEKWALVLLTFDYGSPQAKTLVSNTLDKYIRSHRVITGIRRDDGKFGFVASSEFEEKIQAKIKLGVQWQKIRLYPP
jgi:hypothetical protein